MMSQPYYIYHISITDIDRVRIRKHGPKQARRESSGKFDYVSHKDYLYALHEEARQNRLTGVQVQDLGQKLFKVLFDDSLSRNFLDFYEEVVRNKNALLRLELDVD